MVDPIPLLRYTLSAALATVNGRAPWFYSGDWHRSNLNGQSWKKFLDAACFTIIAKGLTGPDVDLIVRAVRNLHQAGEILWDDAETPDQIEAERPFVERVNRYEAKRERLRQGADKRRAAMYTPILTEAEKAKLCDSNAPLLANARIGSYAAIFTGQLPIHKREFQWDQLGVGYYHVDSSTVVSRLIRVGILDVIDAPIRNGHPDWAVHARVQHGPKFLAYSKRWNGTEHYRRVPEHQKAMWKSLVSDLNAKWNTDFDWKDWFAESS